MALFFRDATLLFGPVFSPNNFPVGGQNIAFQSYYDLARTEGMFGSELPKYEYVITSIPQDNVRVRRLRISFNVHKKMEGSPNKSTIKVYNITKEKWDVLNNSPREMRVALYAGYLDNLYLIFTGDITNTSYEREGTDWVGVIESGDGEIADQNSITSVSCEDGTNLKNVLYNMTSMVSDTGNVDVTKANAAIAALDNIKATAGHVYCGKTKDTMNEILQTQGYRTYINNSELCIVDRNGTWETKALYLTPLTGLIGSPKNLKDGINFKTLLIPGLDIGSIAAIDSYNIKGYYTVNEIIYNGDTHGGDWSCSCEGSVYLGIPENNPIMLYEPVDGLKLFKPIDTMIKPEDYPEDWKSNYKYDENGNYVGYEKPESGIDRFYDSDGRYIGGGS